MLLRIAMTVVAALALFNAATPMEQAPTPASSPPRARRDGQNSPGGAGSQRDVPSTPGKLPKAAEGIRPVDAAGQPPPATPPPTPPALTSATASVGQPLIVRVEASPEDPFWPPVWSNWALLMLGGATAWIALGSLEQLKRQVDANNEAALAAKDAADAAAEATRIAQTELRLSKRAYVRVLPTLTPMSDGVRVLTCILTNVGSMPGRLERLAYHSVTSAKPLEGPPDYERIPPIDENGQTIFPGENMLRRMPFRGHDPRLEHLIPDSVEWFYGELRYRDVFDDVHRTRFCGRFENGEFLSDGPAEFHDSD